jgi:prolyl-tRNA synthetase
MRGREFIMKDAYSFDQDEAGAESSYQAMYQAYQRIFARCGLDFAVVEADSGAIGGSYSHEFMVLADTGEDALAACTGCGYAANLEKAELKGYPVEEAPSGPIREVHTPDCKDVPALAKFMGVPQSAIVKSMLFSFGSGEGRGHVLVLIPGHRTINLVKLKNALGGEEPALADPAEAERLTGVPKGFVTPVGTPFKTLADQAVPKMASGVVGAGKKDYHLAGAKPGIDFPIGAVADLAEVEAGDPCPRCGAPLLIRRGIEVGHVFKLGTKYSQAMGATYAKADGSEAPVVMGCYGIGLGRTLAAAIEQGHDADGIVWPMALAPFQAILLPLEAQLPEVAEAAERLFGELLGLGIETLLDDRDLRPGPKFKDADLIGIPIKVIISRKGLAKGEVEVKNRKTRETALVPLAEASAHVAALAASGLCPEGTGPSR